MVDTDPHRKQVIPRHPLVLLEGRGVRVVFCWFSLRVASEALIEQQAVDDASTGQVQQDGRDRETKPDHEIGKW